MLTSDGVTKIIDFGLAKLRGLSTFTGADRVMGTVAYLSPEQARGEEVDQRTDIWSLGAVLYEMLTGHLPFRGEHPVATIHNILTANPRPLLQLRPDVPPEMDRIIRRALEKNPGSRYPSAAEFLTDLIEYHSRVSGLAQRRSARRAGGRMDASEASGHPGASRLRRAGFPARVVGLPAEQSPLGERDTPAGNHAVGRRGSACCCFGARASGGSHTFRTIRSWPSSGRSISRSISVKTTPPGADVYIKEYHAVDSNWTHLGTSPLDNIRIPPGLFRWKVEKTGFTTKEDLAGARSVSFALDPAESVPDGMVRIQGGSSRHNMIVSGFESVEVVQLQDYWMDRYEVTNKQFKRFVDGGGYQKRGVLEPVGRKKWPRALVGGRDQGVS